MEKVKLVELSTDEYIKCLATCKYLINDNTFLPFFVKREEQIYLNTWHGTPLKTLGKSIKNAMHGIGNAQKNFVTANYLLYPNKYTMEHMVEDYMLGNITDARCVLSGYPRNSAFFRENLAQEVRKSMEIPKDMRIYVYMPTWRGAVGDISGDANERLRAYLQEIDKAMEDDERLYLNLHPIADKDIDVKGFKHIRNIPVRFDTYDFLACTDCLVTDYSSVLYDYAVSGKKVVLFTYDEDEYFADRGMYISLSELPFPKVKSVGELLEELRTPKQYDDNEFIKEYCCYDCKEASENILDCMISGANKSKTECVDIPCNGKESVLIYADNIDITAIRNIVNNEYNYYVCFFSDSAKGNGVALNALVEFADYFPIHIDITSDGKKAKLWKKLLSTRGYVPKRKGFLEVARVFGNVRFKRAINLSKEEINLSKYFK